MNSDPKNEKKDNNPNIERERHLNELKRDQEREAEDKRKQA
jgi:hypothetical protein